MYRALIPMIAASLVALGACGIPAARTVDHHAMEGSRSRWSSFKFSDYEFEIENRCYCTIQGDYRVTVRDNRVADVFDLRRGQHLPHEAVTEHNLFRTINELFVQLDTICATGPEVVDVAFDPEY